MSAEILERSSVARPRLPKALGLAGLLLLALAGRALGQQTDVIVHENGDQVTGEIESYAAGYLTVDSINAGYVSLKWNKIISISSAKRFEVETADAVYHYGTLEPSKPPGKLVIVGSAGETETVEFLDVVRFSPLYTSFWQRLEGSLDLGFNYDSSSDIVQLNLNATATTHKPAFATTAALYVFYNRQQGVEPTQRANLTLGYEKFLKERWIVEGFGALDRNLDLGVDLRISLGAGVARNLILTNQTTLRLGLGFSGQREYPTEGSAGYDVAAVVSGSYGFFTYKFPKLRFGATLQVIPYLTDAGRVRLQLNAYAKREVIHNFYISLSVFDGFDSRNPSTQSAENDWGPVLSVSWTF